MQPAPRAPRRGSQGQTTEKDGYRRGIASIDASGRRGALVWGETRSRSESVGSCAAPGPPVAILGRVNLEKVVFGFFVLLAATLNFGFFLGDIADPRVHNINELYVAVVVNLIATLLKFGDRTQIGAVHLATSLVADIQLLTAAGVWIYGTQVSAQGSAAETISSVVSLSGGALLANVVSVTLLVIETVSFRRR